MPSTPAQLRWSRAALVALAAVLLAASLGLQAAGPAAAEPPPGQSVFGGDVRDYQVDGLVVEPCPEHDTSCVQAAGLHWARQGINWTEAQQKPPAAGYTSQPAQCTQADGWCYWDQAFVDAKKAQLKKLTDRGIEPIVIVQWVPAWVNGGKPNKNCYLPTEQFGAYTALLGNLVREFKAAGIPVRHWQVWNEPETSLQDLGPGCGSMGIGSFGDPADEYYGGGRFGELMSKVYPAVKAADPDAKVLPGGWALPCVDCPPAKFFEGMLRYDADGDGTPDGAKFFDIYDYHAYAGWSGTTPVSKDWSFSGWNATSSGRGYFFDKLNFVRGLLNRYGAGDKPIVLGEVALTCYNNAAGTRPCPDMGTDAQFTADQANMVVRTYTRAMHYGLLAVEWYSFGDGLFEQTELVDVDAQTHKPIRLRAGFHAFKALAAAIGGATYKSELTCRIDPGQELCQPGASPVTGADQPYKGYTFEGYEFCQGTTGVQVLWANDKTLAPASWALPAGAEVYDQVGQRQDVTGTLPVGFTPSIVKLPGHAACAPPPPPTEPPTTAAPTTTTEASAASATTAATTTTTALVAAAADDEGALPFTGAGSVLVLLLAGLVLAAVGAVTIVSGRVSYRGRH
jgi:hypothetical protein